MRELRVRNRDETIEQRLENRERISRQAKGGAGLNSDLRSTQNSILISLK